MFIILAYDVGAKRNSKVMKTVKKYIRPVQKSVFDGEISQSGLTKLKEELIKIIDVEKDAVVIYRFCWGGRIEKDLIGIHKPISFKLL